MHIRKQYIVPLAALVISLGIISANLLASEPLTADEIVAKSREHFEAASSFETNRITNRYFNPNIDAPPTSNRMRIEWPSSILYLTPEGTTRIIYIDNTMYHRSGLEDSKWTRRVSENVIGDNTDQRNILTGFFPPTFFDAELIDTGKNTYVIEGFGTTYNRLGLLTGSAAWHRLKIRKSDFALVESAIFDFPIVNLDENGQITQTIEQRTDPDGTQPLAHIRSVTEVSRYDDFSIQAPSDSDIVVEIVRVLPKDGATVFDLREQLVFISQKRL